MKKYIFFLLLVISGFSNAQTKTTFYANGNKMSEGSFINPDPLIFSTEFDTFEKEKQERIFANSKKDGAWKKWYENGTICSEEMWSNGKMIGHWKQFNKDGKLFSEINYGSGISTFYYPTGEKESQGLILENHILEGEWVGFHENGKMSFKGNYKAGKKDGIWIFYDTNGVKITEQKF